MRPIVELQPLERLPDRPKAALPGECRDIASTKLNITRFSTRAAP
jgi:hypothetical protein